MLLPQSLIVSMFFGVFFLYISLFFNEAVGNECCLKYSSLDLTAIREFLLDVWCKYQTCLTLAGGCSHCIVEKEISDAVRCV